MKTQIKLRLVILLVVTFGLKTFTQDSTTIVKEIFIPKRTQIFSLSPISKKVDLVNGLVLGAGHLGTYNDNYKKINGVNIEVNPLGLFVGFFILRDPLNRYEKNYDKNISNAKLKVNGLNISTGPFIDETNFNGLNISTFNIYERCNGFNITPFLVFANEMNGMSIASLNVFNNLNGVSIGLINKTNNLNGIQIGLYNSSNSRGFQLGFWNTNSKRTMPFINW